MDLGKRLGGWCLVASVFQAACLDLAPGDWQFGGPDAGATDSGAVDSGVPFVEAAHAAWPQVVNDGGAVIAHPRLVTIVTGADPLAPNWFALGDAIVYQPWLATVGAEYGVGSATSGGDVLGPALPDGGSVNLDWTLVTGYVDSLLGGGAPAPDGQSVYVVFLPAGATIYGNLSPYWSAYAAPDAGALGDMLLAIPWGTALSGESRFDAVTRVATQHFIDVVTDPWPPLGPAWELPLQTPAWDSSPMVADQTASYRVGDLCELTRAVQHTDAGDFAFSRVWSNEAASRGGDPCIPALSTPYYNVSFEQTWYAADAGQTVQIPMTGWSTGPMGDWQLYVGFHTPGFGGLTLADLTIQSDLGVEQVANCTPYPGMNNGVGAMLNFTVPAGVDAGSSVAFFVTSVVIDPALCSDQPVTAGDAKHNAYVGVYVP